VNDIVDPPGGILLEVGATTDDELEQWLVVGETPPHNSEQPASKPF
jgi:hypothetical protein